MKLSDFSEVTQACQPWKPLWILEGVSMCVWVCVRLTCLCACHWLCLAGMYMSSFFHNEGDWCSPDISWISKSSLSLQTLLVISSVCDIASKVHGLESSPLGRVLTFVFALLTIWDEARIMCGLFSQALYCLARVSPPASTLTTLPQVPCMLATLGFFQFLTVPWFSSLGVFMRCSIFLEHQSLLPTLCAPAKLLSSIWLSETLWTVAHQAPLSIRFSRQEYWSGLPCLPPGNLPNPGIEPTFPASAALQAESLLLSHWGSQYPLFKS